MTEPTECPHGLALWYIKDHGCDECLNEAYDKLADEHKRPNPDDRPEWPEEPEEPNPWQDEGGESGC